MASSIGFLRELLKVQYGSIAGWNQHVAAREGYFCTAVDDAINNEVRLQHEPHVPIRVVVEICQPVSIESGHAILDFRRGAAVLLRDAQIWLEAGVLRDERQERTPSARLQRSRQPVDRAVPVGQAQKSGRAIPEAGCHESAVALGTWRKKCNSPDRRMAAS
jgi:hypothetical protein